MSELYLKILAAIASAIILAVILIRKDRRSEPLGWLVAAVGLGVLVGPCVLLLGHLGILPDIQIEGFASAFLSSFADAAIPEECLKFIALYLLVRHCKHFDEKFDGVVYAVCIGMGFAGLENILYLFVADEEWMLVGISRALLSVPAHYSFAVIMGTFFALGWFDRRNRKSYMIASLILPIIVHGLYDKLCFSIGINEDICSWIFVAFLVGFNYIRKYVKSLAQSMLKLDEYGATN